MDIKMYKQTNVMSPNERINEDSTAETIDEDSNRCDYFTGELLDRTKYIAGRKKELDQLESFGVVRRVKKNEATDGAHVRMKIIAHNKRCSRALETCRCGSQSLRTSRRVCRHTRIESVPYVDRKSSQSYSPRIRSSQSHRNP